MLTSWLCPGWFSLRIKVLRCCQSPCEVLLSQGSSLTVIRSRPSAASESPGKGLTKENFYCVSAPVRCPFVKAKPVFTLGVILGLTFNNHVSSLSSSLLSSLCQISRIRHLFPKDVLYIMLNSIVFSKLFYCSAVWSGTYKQSIHNLQLLQNFAARILTDTTGNTIISPRS